MDKQNARIIASYLPQFQPTKENDEWWGKGFTEWTNVGKAKPLFKGHYQPRVPADLGYYDLRLSEVREAQAEMAKTYGIEGFCYWHYWFGNGSRLLDQTFNEVLHSGKPDYPFCLAWANETWSGVWHGARNKILMEQLYPGDKDYEDHFYVLLKAFHDHRYIRVDDKPIFMIYKPSLLPDAQRMIDIFQNLAIKNGLPGIYMIGQTIALEDLAGLLEKGFDAVNIVRLYDYEKYNNSLVKKLTRKVAGTLRKYEYSDAIKYFSGMEEEDIKCIPTIIPNWDHSPRSGVRGLIYHNSTPELFKRHVLDILNKIKDKPAGHKIAFLKSWNEWGEGNYMEPDIVHGHGYLQALKDAISLVNFDNN